MAQTVHRYYEVVADLYSTVEELAPLLHPDGRFTEHPNLITPRGAVRKPAEVLAGFRAGKALLSEQAFDLHEIIVDGDRVSVRATWTGAVGVETGPFRQGDALTAHIAAFVTVNDGRIIEHDTYDCYEPFPAE